MTKIGVNIRHLRLQKGRSQEQMADDLGVTRARLGAYEEGRNEPPLEILMQVSDYFHVSMDALVRGDLTKATPDSLLKIGSNRLLLPVMVDQEGIDQIEVVSQKASAGYLSGYADPDYVEKLPSMRLPFAGQGKMRTFPIIGDSMPPLSTGDYVVGRLVENPKEEVVDGRTYIVVSQHDGITYKRVYWKGKALELKADNPVYTPYRTAVAEVLELWSFVCSLRLSEDEPEQPVDAIMRAIGTLRQDIKELKRTL